MSFEDRIRSWVALDNQLRILQDKAKEIREEKNAISDNLMAHVAEHSMESTTVRISDGRLRFVETNQTSPLTLKFVQDCLVKCLHDETMVGKIMSYIKSQRETKVRTEVKRYYIKE
jgi:hypothetical protein